MENFAREGHYTAQRHLLTGVFLFAAELSTAQLFPIKTYGFSIYYVQ